MTDEDGLLLLLTPDAPIDEPVEAVEAVMADRPDPVESSYPTG